jgi:hypothetical protein
MSAGRIKPTQWVAVLASCIVGIGFLTPAAAERMHYKIAFALGQPTGGSFDYDPGQGTVTNPDPNPFSNFKVHWNGRVYDLTASANAPSVTATPTSCPLTSAALSFALLTAAPCVAAPPGIIEACGSSLVGSGGDSFEFLKIIFRVAQLDVFAVIPHDPTDVPVETCGSFVSKLETPTSVATLSQPNILLLAALLGFIAIFTARRSK